MSASYFGTRTLPFLMEFSPRDHESAEKAAGQQDDRRRKAAEALGQKVERMVDEARRQATDLLGARELAQLREDVQRERLAWRGSMQPPEGLELDYAKQRAASKRRINALHRKLGTKGEKLSRIDSELRNALRELLTASPGRVVPGYNLSRNLEKWIDLSPLHRFPLPWGVLPPLDDPNDPHRWFLFTPPFFGFLFSFAPQATGNFHVDRQLFLSPPAGLVGNEATMDCDDGGDWNVASATAESQIAVPFVPPTAGIVEVLVDAQSSMAKHDIDIEDEFGFSDAWTYQNNYLMMNVLHPNVAEPSLSLMSNAGVKTDGDDASTHQETLIRGQHYFAHLFSAGPVPAGQTVVVTVGTRSFDIAQANDMNVHSKSNFQWFINSVEVRIAP